MIKAENGDEHAAATKADVRAVQDDVDSLAQATAKTFQRVEGDIAQIKGDVTGLKDDVGKLGKRLDRLESGQAAILKVAESIDEQLKEFRTHPTRIERLERSVFRR
jgi:ubiquinone biosynthesis protein UbiJ